MGSMGPCCVQRWLILTTVGVRAVNWHRNNYQECSVVNRVECIQSCSDQDRSEGG